LRRVDLQLDHNRISAAGEIAGGKLGDRNTVTVIAGRILRSHGTSGPSAPRGPAGPDVPAVPDMPIVTTDSSELPTPLPICTLNT